MEWRFHLSHVTQLDCNAPLPLLGFNFTMSPRAPMLFLTNLSLSSYPYNPNWEGTTGTSGQLLPPD